MAHRRDTQPSHRLPLEQEFISSIKSVHDAMQWHDDVFVEIAYHIMLRRPADVGGRHYYVERLRIGRSRMAVLDQLGKSSEANPLFDQVADLQPAIARFRASRRPLAGLWRRLSDPNIGTRPALNRARALENALGRTRQDVLSVWQEVLTMQQELSRFGTQRGALSSATAEPTAKSPTAYNPRLRSTFEARESDFQKSEKRVINALRV